MKIQEFLRMAQFPDRTNFFVVCSNDLGLGMLLPRSLKKIASPEDYYAYQAENITKAKAREIEAEARKAPRAGSELSHVFIAGLEKLPTDSVGPLLKAAEEARWTRFIFQAQEVPEKIHTLMSRSNVVKLPFLSKKAVLGNLQRMNYDAKTADRLNLYDGTLDGTIRTLAMKDTIVEIRRELKGGSRGVTALFQNEIVNSLALDSAVKDVILPEEREFMDREESPARTKLVLYLMSKRQ